jgi:hypothetical protein
MSRRAGGTWREPRQTRRGANWFTVSCHTFAPRIEGVPLPGTTRMGEDAQAVLALLQGNASLGVTQGRVALAAP